LKDAQGAFVSAHDLIPGTKHDPHFVPYGAIQPDGVAAEFNTAPALNADEFIHNIDKVIETLTETFKAIRPDLSVAITPTATFDRKYFDGLPDIATVLGCTPDFNAYTGEENDPPSTDEPFRTGAGHIHVGFGNDFRVGDFVHFERCCQLVKQFDSILYFSSLIWDDDDKRRSLYGKIGAFRPKSYGVEYRPMSNMYLSQKAIQRFVFDATVKCSELYLNELKPLYDDPYVKEMVSEVRSGKLLSFSSVTEYLRYMTDTYKVPFIGGYIEI
jgi:hypothetical protein